MINTGVTFGVTGYIQYVPTITSFIYITYLGIYCCFWLKSFELIFSYIYVTPPHVLIGSAQLDSWPILFLAAISTATPLLWPRWMPSRCLRRRHSHPAKPNPAQQWPQLEFVIVFCLDMQINLALGDFSLKTSHVFGACPVPGFDCRGVGKAVQLVPNI